MRLLIFYIFHSSNVYIPSADYYYYFFFFIYRSYNIFVLHILNSEMSVKKQRKIRINVQNMLVTSGEKHAEQTD